MEQALNSYAMMLVALALVTDNDKVRLYRVQDKKTSSKSKVIPAWYTSKRDAAERAKGKPLVYVDIPAGLLFGNKSCRATRGDSYLLMYSARKYAQRSHKTAK